MIIRACLSILCLAAFSPLVAQVALTSQTTDPGLLGYYFASDDLGGDPVTVRTDAGIAFDWGTAAPAPGLPVDGFSVRWVGELTPQETDRYDLIVRCDDRVRVWLGGGLVIDSWTSSGVREHRSSPVDLIAGQPYRLVVEYADVGGVAQIELAWQRSAEGRTTIGPEHWSAPAVADLAAYGAGLPLGDGLTGLYHLGKELAGDPALARVDAAIDFDWNRGAPDPVMPEDYFSVRWLGSLTPAATDTYQLIGRSDDGIRVWVDGALVIDAWHNRAAGDTYSTPIELIADMPHAVRVEYYENAGRSSVRLDWRFAADGRETIPAAVLTPSRHRIPAGSVASPAFVEGTWFPDEDLVVTVHSLAVDPIRLGDGGYFVDVLLNPDTPTPVAVETAADVLQTAIAWTPTLLDDGDPVVIRRDAALLIAAPAGGSLSILTESGVASGPTPVPPAGQLACDFPSAGYFTVVAAAPDGTPAGSRDVVVVDTDLGHKSIAAEVGYERPVTVAAVPDAAWLTFAAADGSDLAVDAAPGAEPATAEVAIKPHRRGTPVVVARVGGPTGPILALREVDEFTVDTASLRHVSALVNTGQAATAIKMRPYIPDVFWDFRMFASKSTFAGGVRKFETNTSDGTWVAEVDPDSGETIGRFRLELEIPAGESKYCFDWYASQRNSPKVKITTKKRTNGEACKIEVGGGKYVVPECDDERGSNLSEDHPCLQVSETWEYKAHTFGVAEKGKMGAYQLGLSAEVCGEGPEGVFIDYQSPSDCPAANAPRGGCISRLELLFSGTCDVTWPKVCKSCNDECFNLGLHTGTKPSNSTLTLTDCESGETVTCEDFFQVYHLDLNGYTGPDDVSGKDVFPDAVKNWPDEDEFWSSDSTCRVKGVPVQVLLEGPEKRRVRVVTRSDRVWLSTKPSIVVSPDDTPADHLERCVEVDLSGIATCQFSGLVYMYGVEETVGSLDAEVIEAHMLELHSFCSGGGIEFDETVWAIGDIERTRVDEIDVDIYRLDGSRVEDRKEFGPGSICTIPQPQVGERDTWLDVSFGLPVEGAFSCYRYFIRSVGPGADVAGVVELHRDRALVYTSGEEEVEVPYEDLLAGGWELKGVETGVVDLVLECRLAEDSSTTIGCDRFRTSVAPCAPLRDGEILLVNAADQLDVEDCGYEAYDTVEQALEESIEGDNVAVARGTYPERGLEVGSDRTIVGLGGRWSALLDRGQFDWAGLPTLDGERVKQSILSGEGATDFAILGIELYEGYDELNGGGVRLIDCKEVLVACCKVRKCQATGYQIGAHGGGIAVIDNDDAVLKHNVYLENSVYDVMAGGGAIYVFESSCQITESKFELNKGNLYGGCIGVRGIDATDEDYVLISGNIMTGNVADYGAAIGVVGECDDDFKCLAAIARVPLGPLNGVFGGHRVAVIDNEITGNGSSSRLSVEDRGGAIYVGAQDSEALFEGNTIKGNWSGGDGGGIATFNRARSDGSLNQVEGNGLPTGDDGGGMTFGTQGSGVWRNNVIKENESSSNGGGVHATVGAHLVFGQNRIEGNRSGVSQGGLGGGVYVRNSTFRSLGGNTFEGNVAAGGGGGGFAILGQNNSVDTQATQLANYGPPRAELGSNDVFKGNHAQGLGGGILSEARAINALVFPIVVIDGCDVTGNSANGLFRGSKAAGVCFVGPVTSARINLSRIAENAGTGITIDHRTVVLAGGEVQITGCDVVDNAVGLSADYKARVGTTTFDRNQAAHVQVWRGPQGIPTFRIQDSFFFGSSGTTFGLQVEAAAPRISVARSRFLGWGAGQFAATSGPGVAFVQARRNHWGSSLGPHDPAPVAGGDGKYNVNPAGAPVGDWIAYDPWLP